MQDSDSHLRQGYILGLCSYLLWGVLPVYFKLMSDIAPTEIVAQRVGWSALFLGMVVLIRREAADVLAKLGNRLVLLALASSAVLIGLNWLTYIWAVTTGHILAASLGYFLNPLFNVALGVLVLKEKLRPMQMLAIAIALVGVVLLAFSALDTLWISVTLAGSFGLYGLIRKTAPVEALPGLMIETVLLLPLALTYLVWLGAQGGLDFGSHPGSSALLILSGVVSSVPLLLFAQAARRLSMATLGVLQYLAPSIQFVIGFLFYGEPLGMGKLASFVLIWIGLAVFTYDALGHMRKRAAARA
ncbi:MAG: EamA family transporter RarD [Sphingobium sp.]